jgi:SAM-dependent methyltransferase
MNEQLTEKQYWDKGWERTRLPTILEPTTNRQIEKEFIRIFEKFLPKADLSAVEIGGAPGQFVAYLNKYHNYQASIIEYSTTGCEKTKENFDILGLNVNIYNRDFFSDLSDIPRFDVVLSMGFIEHFQDLNDVLRRHIELLRKGGILILGVPNYAGIGKAVLKRTAPEMLARHNLQAMNLQNWRLLEDTYGLKAIFKGYIGGFAPRQLARCEHRTIINLSIRYFFKMLHRIVTVFPFLQKYNSPNWSAYLLGIYKLP